MTKLVAGFFLSAVAAAGGSLRTLSTVRRIGGDVPLADRPTAAPVERVLGEFRQTLNAMRSEPLPFEIAYRADDSELRRGLNVDVRITFGGRMRFRTINAHVLTLASSPFPQEIAVQPLE